jgi:hypothetical protein
MSLLGKKPAPEDSYKPSLSGHTVVLRLGSEIISKSVAKADYYKTNAEKSAGQVANSKSVAKADY